MKRKIKSALIAVMILAGFKNANSQIQKQWSDFITDNIDLSLPKILPSSQGGAYTIAECWNIGVGPTMLTRKISSTGVLVWQDTLADANPNGVQAKDMHVDASGNVYSMGVLTSLLREVLVKYSSSGVRQWVYTTPSNFTQYTSHFRLDNSGNLIVGYPSLDSILCFDAVQQINYYIVSSGIRIIKLNPSGNVIMDFNYHPNTCSSQGFGVYACAFDVDASGNTYVSYQGYNQATLTAAFHVMKIDGSGNILWDHPYYSGNYTQYPFEMRNNGLKYDAATGHVLATWGLEDSTSSSTTINSYVTAIDNAGIFLWDKVVQTVHYPQFGGKIETDGFGNVYFGYYPPGTLYNFTVKKLSPSGSELWTHVTSEATYVVVNNSNEEAPGYRVDAAGNLYFQDIPGYPNNGQWRFSKYSPSGSLVWQYTEPEIGTGYLQNSFVLDANSNLYFYEATKHTIKYIPCTGVPTIPSAITITNGIAKVCPGETRTYTVNNVAGYTFTWTVPTGASINSGQGTNSINVTYDATFTVAGILSVSKVNSCGIGTPRNLTINRNNPAATITTNGGATTFCSGTNPLILTANAGTGFTYQWKKGSTTLSGATNQSYVPTTTSASYKVIVTNAPGCNKTSANFAVTVNPLPTATITPQGPTTFCAGGSVVLSASTATGLTYQWKKGNGNINGATLQNYTATTAGTYKVVVTNANTCSKTSAGKVVTVNCRETEEESASTNLEVFPNPTNGMVTLKFTSAENQNSNLIVTDIAGRVVLTQPIVTNTGENEITADMSNLVKGVYMLRIKTTEGEMIERIVRE